MVRKGDDKECQARPSRICDTIQRCTVERDDILIVKDGATTGKTAFVSALKEESYVNEHLFIIRPKDGLSSRLLFYWLWSEPGFQQIMKDFRGSAQGGIGRTFVDKVLVPVPPKSIQGTLEATIYALFAEVEDGEREFSEAMDDFETYRRSIQEAALTGKLTNEWRHNNAMAETGLQYVQRLKDRPRKKRSGSFASPDLVGMPQLPEEWTWASLDELINEGPTNGYSPRASASGEGTKSLKLTATSSGSMRLDEDCTKILSVTIPLDSQLYLSPGDVLFQRGNTTDLVGIAAVYEGLESTYVYPDLLIRVRPRTPALSQWIWRWANSPHGRAYMGRTARGAAGSMPKINGETVRRMPVPIGPPAEMEHALDLLERALTDSPLDQSVPSAMLRQSILNSAFRGRL